jgi:hypothetical protein
MTTEANLHEKIEALHKEAVETIVAHIKRIKALIVDKLGEFGDEMPEFDEIRLSSPILHQYIDDQTNEVIGSVSMDEENAIIDTGFDDSNILLNQLNTNVLIAIVGQLEEFETFEDVEMQLI